MTTSTFSTNYTMSNLPGTGRVMGNLYKAAGRRLERTMSKIAQRVGYGPEAICDRIHGLYSSDWSLHETSTSLMIPFIVAVVSDCSKPYTNYSIT